MIPVVDKTWRSNQTISRLAGVYVGHVSPEFVFSLVCDTVRSQFSKEKIFILVSLQTSHKNAVWRVEVIHLVAVYDLHGCSLVRSTQEDMPHKGYAVPTSLLNLSSGIRLGSFIHRDSVPLEILNMTEAICLQRQGSLSIIAMVNCQASK